MITSNKSAKEDIPAKMNFNNEQLENSADISKGFTFFFKTNFSSDDPIIDTDELHEIYVTNITNDFEYLWEDYIHSVTVDEVREVISGLDENKGPGLSLITAAIIKKNEEPAVKAIHKLIQVIFESNVVPTFLKQSKLVPIPKKG